MLSKDSIKTLIASSLYGFYDIIKENFASLTYVNDKTKDNLTTLAVSNNSITLTTDKHQYADITGSSLTINLPTVTDFTVINLYITPKNNISKLSFPSTCKWQNEPTSLNANVHYDFIFTYVNGVWRSGVVSYA